MDWSSNHEFYSQLSRFRDPTWYRDKTANRDVTSDWSVSCALFARNAQHSVQFGAPCVFAFRLAKYTVVGDTVLLDSHETWSSVSTLVHRTFLNNKPLLQWIHIKASAVHKIAKKVLDFFFYRRASFKRDPKTRHIYWRMTANWVGSVAVTTACNYTLVKNYVDWGAVTNNSIVIVLFSESSGWGCPRTKC